MHIWGYWYFSQQSWVVPVNNLYVFFGKISIQVFCLFFIQVISFSVFFFNWVVWVSYLCILLDIWFVNILSHSVGCLSILLIVLSVKGSFLVWCWPTCLFLFLLPGFWCHLKKNHWPDQCEDDFFYVIFREFDSCRSYI